MIWMTRSYRVAFGEKQVSSFMQYCSAFLSRVPHLTYWDCPAFGLAVVVKPLQGRCFSNVWLLSNGCEGSRGGCTWCQSNCAQGGQVQVNPSLSLLSTLHPIRKITSHHKVMNSAFPGEIRWKPLQSGGKTPQRSREELFRNLTRRGIRPEEKTPVQHVCFWAWGTEKKCLFFK